MNFNSENFLTGREKKKKKEFWNIRDEKVSERKVPKLSFLIAYLFITNTEFEFRADLHEIQRRVKAYAEKFICSS